MSIENQTETARLTTDLTLAKTQVRIIIQPQHKLIK